MERLAYNRNGKNIEVEFDHFDELITYVVMNDVTDEEFESMETLGVKVEGGKRGLQMALLERAMDMANDRAEAERERDDADDYDEWETPSDEEEVPLHIDRDGDTNSICRQILNISDYYNLDEEVGNWFRSTFGEFNDRTVFDLVLADLLSLADFVEELVEEKVEGKDKFENEFEGTLIKGGVYNPYDDYEMRFRFIGMADEDFYKFEPVSDSALQNCLDVAEDQPECWDGKYTYMSGETVFYTFFDGLDIDEE